ncbi:hypothetical protein Tco_0725596 [Tanacetum coccineum]|uniref:Retrovirus-related Pol polyprotein from transposon TNT 1-94 n=1 Tax=Tanacetum coccineum TaxID=301880 RepID=A0ABQ4YFI4_9ASTR
MVDRLKLDEDLMGFQSTKYRFRGMFGSLMYLSAVDPIVFVVCMFARYQAMPTKSTFEDYQPVSFVFEEPLTGSFDLVSLGSTKKIRSTAISTTEAEYIAMSGCCAQILWMRSQLKDYGFDFNKIPLYCDNKSAIALCCNNVQHSRSKH